MLKFHLIGKGFISKKHEEAIKSVKGVATTYEDADCVVILSPNFLHYRQAIKAAKDGKTVLVEKPLCLKASEAEELAKYDVYTVFQLRYQPLKIEKRKSNFVDIDISVQRDKAYWDSWKGDHKKSGGALFNLGIHYFDLVFQTFGYPKSKPDLWRVEAKYVEGTLLESNYYCHFKFDLEAEKPHRIFQINDEWFDLTEKENLHKNVYKDLIKGNGVHAKDVIPLISFLEQCSKPSKEF